MRRILSHLLLPHTSNNHRAKILHHSGILFFIIFFFLAQFIFSYLKTDYPAVLGSSIDLSTEELIQLTNKEREKNNLAPLQLNDDLSRAASLKAEYMFANNFWAHNGPDGTTPWHFFKQVGYDYTYAGENLARGFTDSQEVMRAWIASPTHRDNILSPNYEEIGFAVKKGRLLGEDTTLIVEMFGSREITTGESQQQEFTSPSENNAILPAVDTQVPQSERQVILPAQNNYTLKSTALFDSKFLSSSIAMFILSAFIFVLVLDMIIIQRKKIVRVVGHNADHIFFFGAFLLIIIFSVQGLVL